MPWSKDHKKLTRERIVAAAAEAFRRAGVAGVGVSDIMDSAGLTHGGFYAHFKSKDDLLAEALALAQTQTRERLGDADDILEVADRYLSKVHAAHPELGCPIAALGPELARATATPVRRTLANGIQKRIEQLFDLIKSRSPARRKRQAAGALACMVGGMILARGLGGSTGEEFLGECRAFLRDALERSPQRSAAD